MQIKSINIYKTSFGTKKAVNTTKQKPVKTETQQPQLKTQEKKQTATQVIKPVEIIEPKKISTVNLVSMANNPVSNEEIYETLKKHLNGEVKYDRQSAKEFVNFIYDNNITFSNKVGKVDSIEDLQKNLADIEIKNDKNSWKFLAHLVGKLYDTGKIPTTGKLLNSHIMVKTTYFAGEDLSYCTDMTRSNIYIGTPVTRDIKHPFMYLMGTLNFQNKESKNIEKLLDDIYKSFDKIHSKYIDDARLLGFKKHLVPYKTKSADMLIQYFDGIVSSNTYTDYLFLSAY